MGLTHTFFGEEDACFSGLTSFCRNGSTVGQLSVNWPKLLGPFQNGFTTFFDVSVIYHSTSLPVQRSKIFFLELCFRSILCRQVDVNKPMSEGMNS